MAESKLGIIILAAGEGKRMKSALPKVLQPVGGKPMIGHVLETARALSPARVVVVTGAGRDRVEGYLHAHYGFAGIAVQAPQNGTGHAVMCAGAQFSDFTGDLLILYGDCPLVTAATPAQPGRCRRRVRGGSRCWPTGCCPRRCPASLPTPSIGGRSSSAPRWSLGSWPREAWAPSSGWR